VEHIKITLYRWKLEQIKKQLNFYASVTPQNARIVGFIDDLLDEVNEIEAALKQIATQNDNQDE
jgi:hypothetical protein